MKGKKFFLINSIFLIAIISIAGYSTSKKNDRIKSRENSSTTPKNISIENVSDKSFTVEWETEIEFSGYILYGTKPEELTFVGIDTKGANMYCEHSVEIQSLQNNTLYYYVIVSDKETYQNGETPFEVKTL